MTEAQATTTTPADLVRIQARALLALSLRLDDTMAAAFERATDLLVACADARQRVILLGIGKSGLIARKLAATLCSTGTPAHFLHPAEAQHGDLGVIAHGDVVLVLSASGETEEILRLLPVFERRSVPILSLCGEMNSTLARASLVALDSGVTEEACALNLAPTASTTVMLALGDALAIEVSRRRNFQQEDFAELHPGGRLGRRLTPVRELMHTGDALPRVTEDALLPQVIYEMSSKKLGMTTVVDAAGRLAGIISDGDLRRLLEREAQHTQGIMSITAGEVMNRRPATVTAETLAPAALEAMEERKITSLIVIAAGVAGLAAGSATVERDGDTDSRLDAPLGVVHLHDLWSLNLT